MAEPPGPCAARVGQACSIATEAIRCPDCPNRGAGQLDPDEAARRYMKATAAGRASFDYPGTPPRYGPPVDGEVCHLQAGVIFEGICGEQDGHGWPVATHLADDPSAETCPRCGRPRCRLCRRHPERKAAPWAA